MPQATKPKEQDEQAKEEQERQAREWAELVQRATEGETSGARQVKRALTLEREVSVIRKRVNDNREYLRLMDRNEELTEDQATFLDTFYPEKEKGERRASEEVEATRKAHEFARKYVENEPSNGAG